MSKPKKNHIREMRIQNEAVVDAYGPEEHTMGWYYYLDRKMRFPFQARCMVSRVASPLRKGEAVEVRRMAPEETCSRDTLVLIRWQGRNLAVPLSQLTPTDVDETTAEAVSDWHYWVVQGYLF
jgi:Calcium binding